jgi:hypothetical protein
MKFTQWHRLFGITLTDFFTDTAYTVELEKDLSLKKQFLDVVIIEKKDGQIPDELPDGLENMAAHNLVSYKSFRESFDDWSADELIGHFVNYRKQVSPPRKELLPKEDFRLYAVCTRYPEKLAKQTTLKQVKEGVYDFLWGIRNIRLIVTSQISKKKHNAVWLMFSAVRDSVGYGVSHYSGRLDEMSTAIRDLITVYETEEIIAMPYTIEDYRNEIKQRALKILTPEEILKAFSAQEILKGLPAQEILKAFPAQERLKGLPAQEILKAFSAQEILKGLSAEEVFKAFSTEEIEACLKKRQKKSKPRKKG